MLRCVHRIVNCGRGCGERMREIDRTEHEAAACVLRPATCRFNGCANTTLRVIDLEAHHENCPCRSVPCPLGGTEGACLTLIWREAARHRMFECPERNVEYVAAAPRESAARRGLTRRP